MKLYNRAHCNRLRAFKPQAVFLSLLETVDLLLLIDLSLELSVNTSGLSFLFIVKPVLNHSAQMMQESDRTKRRRPIAVGPDAVQKLLGISFIVSAMTSDRPAAPATIRSSMHGHWLTVHFFFLL